MMNATERFCEVHRSGSTLAFRQLGFRACNGDVDQTSQRVRQIDLECDAGDECHARGLGCDRPPGRPLLLFEPLDDLGTMLAVSSDVTTAVTGSIDKTVKIWDIATGTVRRTLDGHEHRVTCLALSADGTTLLTSAYDKTVKVWDLATGVCRVTLWVLRCSPRAAAG